MLEMNWYHLYYFNYLTFKQRHKRKEKKKKKKNTQQKPTNKKHNPQKTTKTNKQTNKPNKIINKTHCYFCAMLLITVAWMSNGLQKKTKIDHTIQVLFGQNVLQFPTVTMKRRNDRSFIYIYIYIYIYIVA